MISKYTWTETVQCLTPLPTHTQEIIWFPDFYQCHLFAWEFPSWIGQAEVDCVKCGDTNGTLCPAVMLSHRVSWLNISAWYDMCVEVGANQFPVKGPIIVSGALGADMVVMWPLLRAWRRLGVIGTSFHTSINTSDGKKALWQACEKLAKKVCFQLLPAGRTSAK